MIPTAMRPRVSQGRMLYGAGWPGRRSPQRGIASTTVPITGTTTQSQKLFRSPRRRSRAQLTARATFAPRYMITRPRTPYVDRKPDAVEGLVNAVDATPITTDGATNAIAATAGVRNRGEMDASSFGQRPPLAPAKRTRDVWVFAATKELVTLDRNTQVMSGATNGMNAFAAVWKGLASAASAPVWPVPNAITIA